MSEQFSFETAGHDHDHDHERDDDITSSPWADEDCTARHHLLIPRQDWLRWSNWKRIRFLIRCLFSGSHVIEMNGMSRGTITKMGSIADMAAAAGFASLEEAREAFKKDQKRHRDHRIEAKVISIDPETGEAVVTPNLPPQIAEALNQMMNQIEEAVTKPGVPDEGIAEDKPTAGDWNQPTGVPKVEDLLKDFVSRHPELAELGGDDGGEEE